MRLPSGHPAADQPDVELLDEVASTLDLRDPNRDAIHTIALRVHEHYAAQPDDFFEGVIDAATGMGKSYVIAGALDYYAALGVRNFAVITPGSTIQSKTVAQFTRGAPKSLLGGMAVEPVVVTPDNFRSPAQARLFGDENTVKLFVFNVQTLLRPTGKQGRRTHSYDEALGKAFYEHLEGLDDLIAFADEYHVYSGQGAFNKAVRGLDPLALVGLTATPNRRRDNIIFKYPLAAAIAEQYVKTPVIVGRKDDRTDERTQLRDGAALLASKERALAAYATEHGGEPLHPIMLVNCADIDHARETVALLRSDSFADGRFAGENVVLEVHSDKSTEERERALLALDAAEQPGSPTRIVVQVGMLKEGWDIKNVYVIVSLRASVSEVLTEQTLGRGLRLPFGRYTPPTYQLLNELEVVAHDSYRDLLKRSAALTGEFLSYRTRVVFTPSAGEGAAGGWTAVEEPVSAPVVSAPGGSTAAEDLASAAGDAITGGAVAVSGTEERIGELEAQAPPDPEPLAARADLAALMIPVTKTVAVPGRFTLEQVVEPAPFRELGRKLAVNPERYLARHAIGGRIVTDHITGQRTAQITSADASTRVEATQDTGDLATARDRVTQLVLSSRAVESRADQIGHVQRLLDWTLDGAGDKADTLLGSYADRLALGIIDEVISASRTLVKQNTQQTEVINAQPFAPRPRLRRDKVSDDRYGKFKRGTAYRGWAKGLYDQAWFDSTPERDLANILDAADDIEVWVRLHIGDLPILWNGAQNAYNPDVLARATTGEHWVIEVKADKDMPTESVQGKRHAALAWTNAVNATGKHGTWQYLLVAERHIEQASGSWSALAALAAT